MMNVVNQELTTTRLICLTLLLAAFFCPDTRACTPGMATCAPATGLQLDPVPSYSFQQFSTTSYGTCGARLLPAFDPGYVPLRSFNFGYEPLRSFAFTPNYAISSTSLPAAFGRTATAQVNVNVLGRGLLRRHRQVTRAKTVIRN